MNTIKIINNPESGKPFDELAREIWKWRHLMYKINHFRALCLKEEK